MNKSEEKKYYRRAAIGTCASLGIALGAVLAAILVNSNAGPVLIGSTLGGMIGALIGTKVRSQAFQFLWIEYPAHIGKLMIFAVLAFLIPFYLFLYSVEYNLVPTLQYIFLFLTFGGTIIFVMALSKVIGGLDELLNNIIVESFSVAFAVAWVLTTMLGLINIIYPIPSDWFIASTVVGFSGLVGRLVVAWKYR